MAYFHLPVCISPQNSFPDVNLSQIRESRNNLLEVIEPPYPGLPAAARRRMGKSVRMAVGAALPILEKFPQPDGIVIATANGGMEDCIKFLNQILEYNEGLLTPANFVQSTSNAGAAQIALVSKNHNYNITHVHRGLAFENALMDIIMLLKENKDAGYLLGSTDEISAYNYNIDRIAGCFRKEPVLNTWLFQSKAKGTMAGEGAFMVLMNNQLQGASAELNAVKTMHSTDPHQVLRTLEKFVSENFIHGEWPDLLMTGENGDERLLPYFDIVESFMNESIPVARFKHFCGEYCTASSFACWLSMQIFESGEVPVLMIKNGRNEKPIRRILIYNNYREAQHAFILISKVKIQNSKFKSKK
ncbi:MAG TPA: beta-ketoacyl synthase chain length factor [Puia sp.]|nr:beta-ketoacyl synthase chain length factor [Puia sp.]